LGTNDAQIFATLEGKSACELAAIKKAYNEQFAAGHGVATLDEMLDDELSGLDRERSAHLAATGSLPPEFAIRYAVSGAGTDETMLRATLAGKSRALCATRARRLIHCGRDGAIAVGWDAGGAGDGRGRGDADRGIGVARLPR
jgi:hypothetical protein